MENTSTAQTQAGYGTLGLDIGTVGPAIVLSSLLILTLSSYFLGSSHLVTEESADHVRFRNHDPGHYPFGSPTASRPDTPNSIAGELRHAAIEFCLFNDFLIVIRYIFSC